MYIIMHILAIIITIQSERIIMVDHHENAQPIFDAEELTDIEVAIHFLKLMDAHDTYDETQCRINKSKGAFVLAENAIESMTNPYAKKLLSDKISER